ncbi:MAG: hypothetical protein PVH87_23825 [Desulfobacteraceae bacterium]
MKSIDCATPAPGSDSVHPKEIKHNYAFAPDGGALEKASDLRLRPRQGSHDATQMKGSLQKTIAIEFAKETGHGNGEDTVEKKDISSNSTAETHINQEGRMDQGDGASQSKGMQLESIPNLFQGLIVIITALGLFKKKSFKDSVSTFATEFVCAGNYLRLADQKQIILGQAEDLLRYHAFAKHLL